MNMKLRFCVEVEGKGFVKDFDRAVKLIEDASDNVIERHYYNQIFWARNYIEAGTFGVITLSRLVQCLAEIGIPSFRVIPKCK